jgi:predicted ABC-type ATPase
MIIFRYVRWKNLLSTGNYFTEIKLDNNQNTLIVGNNGSGKSTIHRELKPEWLGSFVNADEIEKELNHSNGQLNLAPLGLTERPEEVLRGLQEHIKSSQVAVKLGLQSLIGKMSLTEAMALTLTLSQPVDSYLASVLADAIRRELLEQGKTFTFETVMSSRDKVDFMKKARERGYRVYLYFVATDDPEINIDRVRRRVLQGGHEVAVEKVRKRYRESIDLMTEACYTAHRAYVFDNSGTKHKLLAEVEELGNQVSITLRTSQLNPWFMKTALWRSFA